MSTTTTEYSSSRKSRPSMGAAQVNISVGTKNRGGPMVSSVRRSNVVSRSSHGGIVRPAGDVQRMSTATLQAVTGNRQAEKTEMAGLNTKLAGFIERNKFQTATIEALQEELARLKKSKGFNQDRVRDMFKDEMDEARNALADIKKELARLQAENLKLEDKVQDQAEELQCRTQQRDDYQNEVSKLTAMIGDLEGELNAARRSLDNVEMEKKTLKQDLDMCRADNDKLRDETAMAREKQIVLQNELDALYEQHEFDVASLEDEISELRRIIEELRCVTPKIQDKWKSDFKECIRVIQEDYNNRLGLMELECKRRYDDQLNKLQDNLNRDTTDGTLLKSENKKLKNQIGPLDHQIRDLKDENERLKDEIARLKQLYDDECEECAGEKDKLRAEIAGLGDELDCVQDNLAALQNDNMNLSLEIACYKKLLEGEEAAMAKTMEQRNNMQTQGGTALANMISSGGGSGGQSSSSNPQKGKPATPAPKKQPQPSGQGKQQPPKSKAPEPEIKLSESTGTVHLKRSSKGICSIASIGADGLCITLENSSMTKEIDISGWVLRRTYGRNKSKKVEFTIPRNTVIKSNSKLRIFTDEARDKAGINDIVAGECETFGHGNGTVTLTDQNDQNKSTCELTYQ